MRIFNFPRRIKGTFSKLNVILTLSLWMKSYSAAIPIKTGERILLCVVYSYCHFLMYSTLKVFQFQYLQWYKFCWKFPITITKQFLSSLNSNKSSSPSSSVLWHTLPLPSPFEICPRVSQSIFLDAFWWTVCGVMTFSSIVICLFLP